jgi:S-adenosylmethionine synthetase
MYRDKNEKWLFSSESVTEGHPDKICDQISDAVLDAILAQQPNARVACETAVTVGMVLVMGEITTDCYVDIPSIVRNTIKEIGYDRAKYGFDYETCAVLTSIHEQSPDIAMGVDKSFEVQHAQDSVNDELEATGAGDQGMMFGYACSDTEEKMPLPISLAHALCFQLAKVRKEGILSYLRPDGKSQVTVEYHGKTPVRIDTIVISSQHGPKIEQAQIKEDIRREVIDAVIPNGLIDENTKIFINPTGKFENGGPQADSGLTGRKIIVDTYGGYARHGGGAFSGKDPTKVDRSAAYAARYVAKNIVVSGLASECEVQLAYAIGVAHPVSIMINTFGSGLIPDEKIAEIVNKLFDLRPEAIIEKLDLRRPIYRQIAAYGHFGRNDLDLPWENTDMADKIKAYAKI